MLPARAAAAPARTAPSVRSAWRGRVQRQRVVKVRIKPGTRDRTANPLPARGNAGTMARPRRDLYIIGDGQHPVFSARR